MDPLGIRTFPFLARRSLYFELQHILPWSVLAGLVEGQFASVVVSRTFQGTPLMIAVATATPFASYVFSLLWGLLCVGRRKIHLLMYFAGGTVACVAATALIPISSTGAIWFIAQIACAQVLLAGVVTVRSAIWRSNYPREVRGQITSRIQGIRSIVSVLTVQAASLIADTHPEGFRLVFPAAALFGAFGVLLLPRVRVRHELRELRRHQTDAPDGTLRSELLESYSFTALLSPGHVLSRMAEVLRNDRRFANYCVAQFLQGMGNLITIPVAVAIVSRDLGERAESGFWMSTGLLVALPTLSLLASVGRWGRLFDSLGVLRFRVINVICWTISIALGLAAALATLKLDQGEAGWYPVAVGLFALRGIAHGLGQGGGTLAWNLGHLHFASAALAEVYMGIHVCLAGVRGIIAPLMGMWLWTRYGWPVWIVAIAFSLASLWGYAMLARVERREADAGP